MIVIFFIYTQLLLTDWPCITHIHTYIHKTLLYQHPLHKLIGSELFVRLPLEYIIII